MNADFVLLGGLVATMDDAGTECSAVASLHGRIVAIGRDEELRHLIGPETTVLHAEGKRVLPGIVDSHAHPDAYAIRLRTWTLVSPDRVRSREELLATIRSRCAALPPGRWAAFYRLNERQSGGYPTITEIDAASGGRPLFILRTDGHLGLANSAAFAACGIDATTPDPPFGRFDKIDGKLTGLVRETGAHIFLNAVHGQDSEADIAEGMELVQDECLAAGITSVANSLCPTKAIRAYQQMHRDGRWRMRMGIIASGRDEPLVPHLIGAGIRSGFGDEWLRLVGVEWCPDCSTSGRTAAYWDPYVGVPVPGEPVPNTGMLLYEKDDLTQRATVAHAAGLQVMIEGVGDRGIDFALDVMEAALAAHPVADHRMRVEHCCYVTPPILERLKRGGFVDSSATGFMDELGDEWLRLVGVEWCPDCSTSGRTAAYWDPYVGVPVPGEPVPNTGMLLYEKDDLTQRATAAHAAGLQVMIEGVGDRGIDFALDVMEAALAAHPVADHRMRVEHCCYVTPPILDRLKRGGFVDSSATGFMDELGEAYAANRGQEAMRWMWPHRSLIDAGVPAPGHSDFAVCRVSPWTAIAAMVNRRTTTGADLDLREAIAPREAVRAYTWLGAWAQREEHEKGSLEVGKLADLVVLDRDVLDGDPAAIAGTQVVATVVGGALRHRA